VIDTRFFNVVKTIAFTDSYPRDSHLCVDNSVLYIASTGDELVRIKASGASSAILDKTAISDSPADLAFADMGKIAIFAQPVPDGVDVIRPRMEINKSR
jgi:hypothetical protein